MPTNLVTNRLLIREFTLDDAPFILKLLNEPSFHQFIGDRGVRTLNDAQEYLLEGPIRSYQKNGFGLCLTALKSKDIPIGMCGLIKRDSLPDVDIGYAFLPEFWGQGYATEAAEAVFVYGINTMALKRIVGITSADNDASIKVLEKIGLQFERLITLPGDDEEIKLFSWELKHRKFKRKSASPEEKH